MKSELGLRRYRSYDYSEIISKGLEDTDELTGPWPKWLESLVDYVRGIHRRSRIWPERVVITNGEWIVIFSDPEDAFSESGTKHHMSIHVFTDLIADLDIIGSRLFEYLAYQNVTKTVMPLTPAKLSFCFEAKNIDGICHGLRITYGKKAGQRKIEPTIYVMPILFMRTVNGEWFRIVEENEDYEHEVPYHYSHLQKHLQMVKRDGTRLIKAAYRSLGCKIPPKPKALQQYYNDADFGAFRGVRSSSLPARKDGKQFELVTGQYYHYFRDTPLVEKCTFHSWATCKNQGVAIERAILKRSVEPRSFFINGEDHLCSHRATLENKQEPLSEDNKSRCGPRSGSNGDAFCEIYSLDAYLCCQACIFYEVCSQSAVFNLPCIQG